MATVKKFLNCFTVPAFTMSPKFRKALDMDWEHEAGIQFLLYSKAERSKLLEIRKFYMSNVNVSSLDALPAYSKMMTDRYFFVPMYKALALHASRAPTYAYHYAKTGPSVFNIFMKFNDRVPTILGYASAVARNWVDVNILRNLRREHGNEQQKFSVLKM